MQTTQESTDNIQSVDAGSLSLNIFPHPQGCRSYLLWDKAGKEAIAIDPHLDFVEDLFQFAAEKNLQLNYVLDTHTHADHPSGSGALAAKTSAKRVAHPKSGHAGLQIQPADGETLKLGKELLTFRHAPGHTPDHMVLLAEGLLFSGDSLFINSVARTDFLGGDAGILFDTLQTFKKLPPSTLVFPGHDYQGNLQSSIGDELQHNAWFGMTDKKDFIQKLTANPPKRPANMDDLLKLNRNGEKIPQSITPAQAFELVKKGGAVSVIDVRTPMEIAAEHVAGSNFILLDEIPKRAQDVRAIPAPRLLLCASGVRAEKARKQLAALNIGGLTVIEGGINAYRSAGGETVKGKSVMSLERQVRVAAGFLVLLGVALSFLFPPAIFLSAFVGAGLIFAGLTNHCGMALLLAKMPWNKVSLPLSMNTSGGCSAGASSCAATPANKAGGCSAG